MSRRVTVLFDFDKSVLKPEGKKALDDRYAEAEKIKVMGLGESSPVTGSACDNVRPFSKLVECLAPDRRVDIEVQGQK